MSKGKVATSSAFGFLTALSHPQRGNFGGYLILNANGRPLEFHCTAPVKANRAQEILYGPTLDSYLLGEVIGVTLVEKASQKPDFLCIDHPAMFSVRESLNLPVLQILQTPPSPKEETQEFIPWEPQSAAENTLQFRRGCNQIAVSSSYPSDERNVSDQFKEMLESFDLSEPFERIRDAIQEAHQGSRPAA
ncbi:Hypothetical protein PBC10988_6490 [Planctomycetales bacterium 10988]|nr:Hypothetical protein PBC10988_6490 [Planctomycetales bacterium 10988]